MSNKKERPSIVYWIALRRYLKLLKFYQPGFCVSAGFKTISLSGIELR